MLAVVGVAAMTEPALGAEPGFPGSNRLGCVCLGGRCLEPRLGRGPLACIARGALGNQQTDGKQRGAGHSYDLPCDHW